MTYGKSLGPAWSPVFFCRVQGETAIEARGRFWGRRMKTKRHFLWAIWERAKELNMPWSSVSQFARGTSSHLSCHPNEAWSSKWLQKTFLIYGNAYYDICMQHRLKVKCDKALTFLPCILYTNIWCDIRYHEMMSCDISYHAIRNIMYIFLYLLTIVITGEFYENMSPHSLHWRANQDTWEVRGEKNPSEKEAEALRQRGRRVKMKEKKSLILCPYSSSCGHMTPNKKAVYSNHAVARSFFLGCF